MLLSNADGIEWKCSKSALILNNLRAQSRNPPFLAELT